MRNCACCVWKTPLILSKRLELSSAASKWTILLLSPSSVSFLCSDLESDNRWKDRELHRLDRDSILRLSGKRLSCFIGKCWVASQNIHMLFELCSCLSGLIREKTGKVCGRQISENVSNMWLTVIHHLICFLFYFKKSSHIHTHTHTHTNTHIYTQYMRNNIYIYTHIYTQLLFDNTLVTLRLWDHMGSS